jgi:hypothetical protein
MAAPKGGARVHVHVLGMAAARYAEGQRVLAEADGRARRRAPGEAGKRHERVQRGRSEPSGVGGKDSGDGMARGAGVEGRTGREERAERGEVEGEERGEKPSDD